MYMYVFSRGQTGLKLNFSFVYHNNKTNLKAFNFITYPVRWQCFQTVFAKIFSCEILTDCPGVYVKVHVHFL